MTMHKLGIALRGVCMGAADAVPGVSGGTVALISGIYFRLIAAIGQFEPGLLNTLRRNGVKAAFDAVDGTFLAPLLLGIVVGIATLSGLVLSGLEHFPALVWACFLGLVLGAVPMLISQTRFGPVKVVLCLAGLAFALSLGWFDVALPSSTVGYFFGGVLALSAMILPGLSGSFVLLILGLYQPVFGGLHAMDLSVILPFAAGAAVGLLSMVRLLNYLFSRFKSDVMAVLVGLMLGSCYQLWPFQHVQFSTPNGVLSAIGLTLGLGLIWGLDRWSRAS